MFDNACRNDAIAIVNSKKNVVVAGMCEKSLDVFDNCKTARELRMKEVTCRGVWWTPDNPEEQIAGILSFSQQNGTVLELIGSFKEICDVMNLIKLPIVQEMSKEYGAITLVDCQETASSFGSITTQTYHCITFIKNCVP